MPKIIGKSVRVVEHDGLAIDECAGNVATKEDTISIAYVTVSSPTSEPWLTLHYDEWLCVRKGRMDLHYYDDDNTEMKVLTVKEGETVFVSKGERFRPVFPEGNTEYIPICTPAFRPDRCIREEENGESDVSTKLKELHSTSNESSEKEVSPTTGIPHEDHDSVDVLYHMCQKSLWEEAVKSEKAYFPPTFKADGMFTHATAVPERLVRTGNHFYTKSEGEWICLELSRRALEKVGIITIFEEPKAVGETDTKSDFSSWICPHIFGGIPTHISEIVTKTYDIVRDDDGAFLSISGLTMVAAGDGHCTTNKNNAESKASLITAEKSKAPKGCDKDQASFV